MNTLPAGQPSVIGTFSSSPSTINPGGTSTLSWSVTGANSVSIDQGIGLVNAAGTRTIAPASTTVYTISATNYAGTITQSAVTTVNAPAAGSVVYYNNGSTSIDGATRVPAVITEFSSNLNSDGTSTLSWNVTGADTVSIDQYIGMVNAVGTRIVSPAASTLYTLTATWAKGNSTNDIGLITRSVSTVHSGSNTPWVQ